MTAGILKNLTLSRPDRFEQTTTQQRTIAKQRRSVTMKKEKYFGESVKVDLPTYAKFSHTFSGCKALIQRLKEKEKVIEPVEW